MTETAGGKNKTDKEEGGIGHSLYKEAVGTAALTAIMGAGGAVWGAIKKGSIKNNAAAGAGLGLLSSLGFGGYVYDGLAYLFGSKKKEEKQETLSSDSGAVAKKYEMPENQNTRNDHVARLQAEKNQQAAASIAR